MKRIQAVLLISAIAVAGWAAPEVAVAQTYVSLKDPECISDPTGKFTVGGQYNDPGNGVLDNSYSMLVRWQGSNFVSNSVSYNVSYYTGFSFSNTSPFSPPPVGSISTWQRGVQPESFTAGTPAVQLYCNGGGMLINTWQIPHQIIVGGGYNDMFGYQWGSGLEPPAFFTYYGGTPVATTLFVQANIAVPLYEPYQPVGASAVPSGQVSLFAYIKDTTHSSLPPIALVAFTHNSGTTANAGYVSCDYAPGGVWFASGNTTYSEVPANPYMVKDPYSTDAQLLTYSYNPSAPALFYRMAVSPTNLVNIVNAIAADSESQCATMPKGYSANPNDYVVKYAGIIAEPTITGDNVNSGNINDSTQTQVSEGVNFYNLGIYGVIQPLPLNFLSASSRMTHGAAGTFDLPLNLVATNPSTEPRAGAVSGNHTVVFTFSQPVVSGTATISAGTAVAGVPTFSGSSMIVPITGVLNQEYVTVAVTNVTAVSGSIGSGSVRIGFLLADVNQSRVVTVSDQVLINAQVAHAVTTANYLEDVNANGAISVSDLLIANNNTTKALPAP